MIIYKEMGVKKLYLLAGVVASIFFFRYLFLVCVMDEERAAGELSEPNRVLDINASGGKIQPYIVPKKEDLTTKKIGPITFVLQPDYFYPVYFVSGVKIKDSIYPLLFYKYTGPLYIYIPRLFKKVFGENIYSVRTLAFLSFVLFMLVYLKFGKKYLDDTTFASLITLFVLSHPFFGIRFLVFSSWSNTVIFILYTLLLIKMKEFFNNSLGKKEIFIFSIIGGLILHFHLLAGGALFASTIIAFFLTKGFSFKKISIFSILFSISPFLILIAPYATGISLDDIMEFLSKGESISMKKIMLMPFLPLILFMSFVFLPSFFLNMQVQGGFEPVYIFFSGFPGILISIGIIEIIRKRKETPFGRFSFLTLFIYLLFSLVPTYLQPYHFNYIFLIIPPFIFSFLYRMGFSKKRINLIIILGICFNLVQCEMLRKSILNSSLSLPVQKEVLEYLEKNEINEVYNFMGRTGYELLSHGRIKTIDFHPYLRHSTERIYLSLLLARGKVIIVERFKKMGYTTGISKEEVMEVARRMGLKAKILKSFPTDRNPLITLMKVE